MKDQYIHINSNGNKRYYSDKAMTVRHRVDGPAVEDTDGYKGWYLNGKRHREDGPAFEYANGYTEWYLNGELHREDGPAVENANGHKYWYLNGKQLSEDEFNAKVNPKPITLEQISEKFGIPLDKLTVLIPSDDWVFRVMV